MRVALVGVLVLLAGCLQPISLPQPDVSIEPTAPDDVDDLVLVIDDLGDNPAAIEWSIEWQRDGETQADLADAELVPADRTTNGDEWTAVVALVLGDQAGPAGEASVTVGADGDDDSADDDDVVDDDDSGPDDDDVIDPGVGNRLCAAAGVSSNGTYTASACTGPVEAAPGVVTNGTYTIRINRLAPPPE
jgi:hypothetical protein